MLTIVPLGIVISNKPTFPFQLRLIPYYIGVDVVLMILGTIARRHFHNNIPIFHLSTLFDVSFILFTYTRILPNRNKKLIINLWLFFISAWLISGLTIDYYLKDLNTISRILGNGIVVSLSIYHLMGIFSYDKKNGYEEALLTFSLFVFIYYSCSISAILFQDLPRYEIFNNIFTPSKNFVIVSTIPYPFVRMVQIALMVRMILLLPTHITPRKALPKWLRFRLGWRPLTEPPQYRVLPAHLVG